MMNLQIIPPFDETKEVGIYMLNREDSITIQFERNRMESFLKWNL